MIPILFAALVSSSGLSTPEVSRWEVRSDVALPRPLWLVEGLVLQPRVTEVELEMALACAADPDRSNEVRCVIEDAAIRAAAMPGDEGSMVGALEQADAALTGAVLSMRFKKGRITNVLLNVSHPQGVSIRRTTRARDENLRLLVSRAIAGFDFQPGELAKNSVWSQPRTWISQMPGARGTRSVGALSHEVRSDGDGYQVVSGGKGSMAVQVLFADGTPANEDTFRTEIRADARFDASGQLQKRRWGLHAEPTPSSGDGVHGLLGLPYKHLGSVERLSDGQAADIGETGVIEPKHPQPSALQSQRTLGVAPVGWRG